jgi:hypothetical protein
MADWTYNGPSNSDADAVRFLIDDRDEASAFFNDDEIAFLLTEHGDKYRAAAAACEQLAAALAPTNGESGAGQRGADRVANYIKLAERYRLMAARRLATPFAGGISVVAKQAADDDTDRVRPLFSRSMFSDA